ncbi:TPA: restriction endonuclease [Enterococcus faecalis]|uniref:restriction endonuclease n=1 Tax=Enterococcaceae TaxID=81852 RepID=UPI001E55A387|nr:MULTISPECIES: restriction endonuclease [Enterococcaceae]MDT2815725.1 restriction endonuclease [Vagococcus carniphilus]HDP1308534.1 restriction endonuclease [Enterococcus faecalis]
MKEESVEKNTEELEKTIEDISSADILENTIRETMPAILDILLIDRTTSTPKKSKNIIWANENYLQYGQKSYAATAQMLPSLVTGQMGQIIMPRALKSRELQKERTKSKAEVFTPTWIVQKQNDEVDKGYQNDELETYVKRKWLEITCGEAPYMATRYDMETGEIVPLDERVGFVDRKLKRINAEVEDKAEWQRLVEEAYKSSYGFEWSGDSLLLARENLLYTYRDYYFAKWLEEPLYGLFEDIAKIISYNIFQMDGLKYIVPLSEKREKVESYQMSLFDDEEPAEKWVIKPGKRVKLMNWESNKMEFFDKGVK